MVALGESVQAVEDASRTSGHVSAAALSVHKAGMEEVVQKFHQDLWKQGAVSRGDTDPVGKVEIPPGWTKQATLEFLEHHKDFVVARFKKGNFLVDLLQAPRGGNKKGKDGKGGKGGKGRKGTKAPCPKSKA